MGAIELVRPAARSAAVRPHSAASRCSASLFFAPSPRPVGKQSCLVAVACSHVNWEHGRGWEQVWEQECAAFSAAYATVPTVPRLARVRVMRARARACTIHSLSLGTWEHLWNVFVFQRLALFPSLFPALRRVGTWEHSDGVGSSPDRSPAPPNKVEAGNGDPQLPGAGARRKFRAPIARLAAGGELELGRIQQLPTRRGRNGGNLPFSVARSGQVGRPMLEGFAEATEKATETATRLKLGRLSDLDLVELGAGATRRPSAAIATTLRPIEGPGTPNRAPSSPAMLTLHAGRIWIEGRFPGASAGLQTDREHRKVEKMAQTVTRRRGPGGIRGLEGRKSADRARNREAGERAGVIRRRAIARSHETGEFRSLRRHSADVKGAFSHG